jgi:competence ComEA-like helix-hairpin-helix protein
MLAFPWILATSPRVGNNDVDTSWMAAVRNLEIVNDDSGNNENISQYAFDRPHRNDYSPPPTLFYFDPNSISSDDWKKLGLRPKTIKTIQNYLSKGGRFRSAEDLQKIYGLQKELYERLVPYVRVTSIQVKQEETNFKPREPKIISIIDINTADTTAWIALPGIGSKLAARIVNFREKLGGFYAVDQVAETFGLPDSVFQKIKPRLKLENKSLRKININTATLEELRSHPYIRYAIANSIIAYRKEHGNFQYLSELMNLQSISAAIYEKIIPYLTIE